jgi:hypothetical protein
MDFVKKNLVSLICAVVALAALVAVFIWPLGGRFAELQEKVDKRLALDKKASGLLNKKRTLPVFDPNPTATADADTLPRFPSAEIIKVGSKAVEKMHAQSGVVYDTAWRMNQQGKGLVAEGSLPAPRSSQVALNFRRTLQAALDKLRQQELLAGIPPTDEEMKNRAGVIWDEIKKKFIIVNGEVKNEPAVMAEFQQAVNKLPGLMKEEMATKYRTYVDPANVMRVPAAVPADGRSPSPEQMWWAQVAYWLTQDVANAVKEVNGDSRSVTTSPVKNLLLLDIPDTFFPPVAAAAGGAGRGAVADDGAAATPATGGLPDPTVAIADGAALSPTKRVSNNVYDVVHFRLVVDVEADKVPLFVKTLSTNRFISVTRLEMNPVDSALMQIRGYVYGDRPVVTLDLDCEAILMREWTIRLMPKGIRDMLGIPDPSTAGKTTAAAQ